MVYMNSIKRIQKFKVISLLINIGKDNYSFANEKIKKIKINIV